MPNWVVDALNDKTNLNSNVGITDIIELIIYILSEFCGCKVQHI